MLALALVLGLVTASLTAAAVAIGGSLRRRARELAEAASWSHEEGEVWLGWEAAENADDTEL